MHILIFLLIIAVLGALSHFIGEALPRSWFDPERAPYVPRKWEDGGRVYRKIGVHKWKDRLPDMSKLAPDMVRKSVSITAGHEAVARVAVETCVAEAVHWALLPPAILFYIVCPNAWGAAVAIVYALSNLPFIIIQRYNRPTLVLLAKRLKEREERIKKCKS